MGGDAIPGPAFTCRQTELVLARIVGGAIRAAEGTKLCGGYIYVCAFVAFLGVTSLAPRTTLAVHPRSKIDNMESFSKDLSAALNHIPRTHSPRGQKRKASALNQWENTNDSDAWTDTSSESSYGSDDYNENDDGVDIRVYIPRPSTTKPTLNDPRFCATCKNDEKNLPTPLKHCAICKRTLYCSRECQTADWKAHKQRCGKAYLQPLPEKDVFAHLIDAYRLRIEDEYVMNGNVSERSLYGEGDPTRDFQRFLDRAEQRDLLLPNW